MRSPVLVTAILFTIGAHATAIGGSLNPPAGPIAPTPGPEPRMAINATNTPGDADSVYKITAPGSYYLAGNLTGVAAKHGIEITASGVTIDLMGFEVAGVPGSLDGITTSIFALRNIEIRNGTVALWGQDGIDLDTIGSEGSRIESIRTYLNQAHGILGGSYMIITGCVALSNLQDGIASGPNAVVTECLAARNGARGFGLMNGCVVHESAAHWNGTTGIAVMSGSNITACSSQNNIGDGITVSVDCVVKDNACDGNGYQSGSGAGILATGGDNRIEGNNCTDNDRGIEIDAVGNVIIRNVCSGNTTNWDVVSGNAILVVDATAFFAGAILGDSGGVSPGSTHPNANFTY